ncbi:hypothetical protein ACTMU2_08055, partial [Cupriavidus basilensis]
MENGETAEALIIESAGILSNSFSEKLNQNNYPIPSREEILGVLRTSGSPQSGRRYRQGSVCHAQGSMTDSKKRLAAMERDRADR